MSSETFYKLNEQNFGCKKDFVFQCNTFCRTHINTIESMISYHKAKNYAEIHNKAKQTQRRVNVTITVPTEIFAPFS